MRDAIVASTADNPLFIMVAGPTKVIGEGMMRADKMNSNALNHVTLISHSDWNEMHAGRGDKNGGEGEIKYEWGELKKSFGNKANFVEIPDQNGNRTNTTAVHNNPNPGFNTRGTDECNWMTTIGDANVKWVHDRIVKVKNAKNQYDFSDAGMAYYLVTGDKYGNCTKRNNFV